MSDDIEKGRVDYVMRLEMQLKHAQSELAKYRAIAEKFQPILHAEVSTADQQVRFTMSFGGKRSTATVPYDLMLSADETWIVTGVIDALVQSNVADRLREIVQPEVQRLQPSIKAISIAGKW